MHRMEPKNQNFGNVMPEECGHEGCDARIVKGKLVEVADDEPLWVYKFDKADKDGKRKWLVACQCCGRAFCAGHIGESHPYLARDYPKSSAVCLECRGATGPSSEFVQPKPCESCGKYVAMSFASLGPACESCLAKYGRECDRCGDTGLLHAVSYEHERLGAQNDEMCRDCCDSLDEIDTYSEVVVNDSVVGKKVVMPRKRRANPKLERSPATTRAKSVKKMGREK